VHASGSENTARRRISFYGKMETMLEKLSKLIYLWFPPLLLCGVIFIFSSIPGLTISTGFRDLVLRKMAHFSEYAFLSLLFYRALQGKADPDFRKIFFNPAFCYALALTVFYAATDESHQLLVPTRNGNPADWGIDALGALGGLVIYNLSGKTGERIKRSLNWK
jgi:hypothetical protein